MSRKRYRPEEIIGKLREADVLISQGKKVVDVIKALEITDVTYYRWRQEYGGMSVSQVNRLKELEKENERLRKAVSDLIPRCFVHPGRPVYPTGHPCAHPVG